MDIEASARKHDDSDSDMLHALRHHWQGFATDDADVGAELDRQFPGREVQKAQTLKGLRDGWDAVQAAWETTVTNTPPALVDAHVENEWSLSQTLRHLVLATDAWLHGAITGRSSRSTRSA